MACLLPKGETMLRMISLIALILAVLILEYCLISDHLKTRPKLREETKCVTGIREHSERRKMTKEELINDLKKRHKEANEFIIEIADKLNMDTDGVGFDGIQLSMLDFEIAIKKIRKGEK